MTTPSPASANLRLLSRNPIFTSAKTVWGVMKSRPPPNVSPEPPAPDEKDSVGAAVIAGDYVGLNSILARNKKKCSSPTPGTSS